MYAIIVERYNGTMNISIEDGFFTNKIILYGVQAKNDEYLCNSYNFSKHIEESAMMLL